MRLTVRSHQQDGEVFLDVVLRTNRSHIQAAKLALAVRIDGPSGFWTWHYDAQQLCSGAVPSLSLQGIIPEEQTIRWRLPAGQRLQGKGKANHRVSIELLHSSLGRLASARHSL